MRIDRLLPAIPIAVAAVYLYATEQIPDIGLALPISGKVFPRILGIALMIGSLLWLIEAWRTRAAPEWVDELADRSHWWVITAVLVWTTAYYAALQWLGYLLATTVYLLALMLYFNRRHWVANVLTSVFFGAGSYFLFYHLLGVPLPTGFLGF